MGGNDAQRLYFAYGSNLSTEQMQERCPGAQALGMGLLQGWQWIINQRGYANIVEAGARDKVVYGLMYSLPPDDEERLDGFEGVPHAYTKEQCWIKWQRASDHGGSEGAQALVYVDRRRTAVGPPRDEYVGRMERAVTDAVDNWGMPAEYAEAMLKCLY
ncbi:hypothetical protein CDD82_5377 [Ophiocordyceps australis]|uniref:gamma-glutamylcyclotransferase n=1 Tax=Ophiocordyceps australis TaxID=1399860 RepID=A0A2C5YVM0_9HYPO|nr:hypothetical protein CDD82_5377 [Ophiocordyceps australis]